MMPISYASENSEEDFSLEENIEAATSEEESNSEWDWSPEVIDENLWEETEDETVEDEIKEEKEEVKESAEDEEEKDSVETDVNIEWWNDEEPEEGDWENLELEDEEKVEDESDVENDENNWDKDLEETGTWDEESWDEETSWTWNRETLGSWDSEALETWDLDDEKGDTNDNVEWDNEPEEDDHWTAELDDGVGKDEEENSEWDENLEFESLESPIDVVAMLLWEPLMAMAPVTFVNYEDNVTTYVDTQWNEFEMWTITITNGMDSITILDRNLWASTNDISSPDSFGYHFQWWNNYGFANNVTPQTSTTQVNASSYWWSNPYVGNIFIKANNWDSSNNSNLWWWVSDFSNNWSENTTNQWYKRQWPCPEWYHVPSEWERNKLMTIYRNSKWWWSDLQYGNNNLLFVLNLSEKISEFRNDLKIPFGWIRNHNDSNFIWSNLANLWSSSFNAGKAYYFYFIGSERTATSTDDLAPWYGFSVRCFKNSENDVTLSFETNGWQKIQWQTVPVNWTAHIIWYNPSKIGASFDWWYKDEEFTKPFQFGVDVLTEDTTIYAKWLEAWISYQDNVTTYIDTQWKEFSMWTITYVDDDGNSKIILDRNLWATERWTWEDAYGYYFQWWNNYGFANNITPNISTIRINASNYSWSNPYVSNIFIWSNSNPYNWSTVNNVNLWWWINESNPDYMRQWPCPPKYHIPTAAEVENFFLKFDTIWENMNNAFLMPYAWSFAHDDGRESERGERSMLWLSTPDNTAPTFLDFYSNINARIIGAYRTWWFNIRCFEDTTPNEVILSFETNGWQKIQWQTVPLNWTAHVIWYEPEKDGYTFWWWYKDEEFTQLFQFWVDALTGDTTIYAKWIQPWISYADNVTTYIDTQWNEFEMWTITYTDTWWNSITILDRNLWATESWTWANSYWYHFQWWNNYGFVNNITPKTSYTKVNTSNYSWTNPYISDVFITASAGWETNTTSSLWWWNWEYDYMRQWPCPAWYHVPTLDEITSLFASVGNLNTSINENLYIPYWGIRRYGAGAPVDYLWTNAYLWSSTIYQNISSYYYKFSIWNQPSNTVDARSYWFSVRCFADTTPNEVILSFETNWWQKIQWQAVPLNWTAHVIWYNPEKDGYTFWWWYKDEEFTQPFQFWVDVLTEDITLYAKWNKPRCQNQWTQYSWVVWNCEEWTITVTDWIKSITMKDMNVWATEVSYWVNASTWSYWLYYQWWWMTGYSYDMTQAQVIASWFIWDNTGYSAITNWWTEEQQREICGEWYHIPTSGEMQSVINMFTANGNAKKNFYNAFKIPFAGSRRYDGYKVFYIWVHSYSWSNSFTTSDKARILSLDDTNVSVTNQLRSSAISLRCFKDLDVQTYTVTFDSKWWTEVESIVVEENSVISQPTNPTKSWYAFSWWYLSWTDELWNFSINIITWDITLYAKWKNNEPLSVSAPSLITFPSITVSRIVMSVDVNVNDYFSVNDPIWSESGWRITIEATDLSWSLSVIDKSNIYLKAWALETVGELNEAVHINQNLIDDFVSLWTPINYIYRTTTTNHKTWEYRDKPTLRVRVPAYQSADTYSGKIVVTLYEN